MKKDYLFETFYSISCICTRKCLRIGRSPTEDRTVRTEKQHLSALPPYFVCDEGRSCFWAPPPPPNTTQNSVGGVTATIITPQTLPSQVIKRNSKTKPPNSTLLFPTLWIFQCSSPGIRYRIWRAVCRSPCPTSVLFTSTSYIFFFFLMLHFEKTCFA